MAPLLLVVSGLPGAGKTTLCRQLAIELAATHLRIDTIEEAISDAGSKVGPLGYTIAYAIASDNLRLGNTVMADSVNSIEITRSAWRRVAAGTSARALELEIVCSDAEEHRRRIEARLPNGRMQPTWTDVRNRAWEAWTRPVTRIDTANRTIEDCVREIRLLIADDRNETAPPDEPTGPFSSQR